MVDILSMAKQAHAESRQITYVHIPLKTCKNTHSTTLREPSWTYEFTHGF